MVLLDATSQECVGVTHLKCIINTEHEIFYLSPCTERRLSTQNWIHRNSARLNKSAYEDTTLQMNLKIKGRRVHPLRLITYSFQ